MTTMWGTCFPEHDGDTTRILVYADDANGRPGVKYMCNISDTLKEDGFALPTFGDRVEFVAGEPILSPGFDPKSFVNSYGANPTKADILRAKHAEESFWAMIPCNGVITKVWFQEWSRLGL